MWIVQRRAWTRENKFSFFYYSKYKNITLWQLVNSPCLHVCTIYVQLHPISVTEVQSTFTCSFSNAHKRAIVYHEYWSSRWSLIWTVHSQVKRALCFYSIMLGITRFDLLGDFGRYNWLGNFYIVFLYNMLFAALTSASLIKTVTWAVQRELIRAFGQSSFIIFY